MDSYSHLVLDVSFVFTLQLTTVDRWEKVNPDESVETDVWHRIKVFFQLNFKSKTALAGNWFPSIPSFDSVL